MKASTFLRTYCVTLLAFFYVATLSAAELPGKMVDAVSQPMDTGKAASGEALLVITPLNFKGYADNFKGATVTPTFQNMFVLSTSDCQNTYCKEIATIPLYRSSNENKWGLASLHDGFNLNLQTTMKNLGVILQHRF
jgi:hypothetical protein